MKLRALMATVVLAMLLLIPGILYAANGDLTVNGNLGVGTTTPQGKAEVNGNMIVDGDLGVGTTTPTEKTEINGNLKVNKNLQVNEKLCVGGNCTSTLQIKGGLYGYCYVATNCTNPISPAICVPNPAVPINTVCGCASDYTLVALGASGSARSNFACMKN